MSDSRAIRLCGLVWAALFVLAASAPEPENVAGKMITIPGQYGDRLTVYGRFLRPPQLDRRWPAVILLHGGFASDSSGWFAPEGGLAGKLVLEGYAVLALDQRGSSGHSREFADLDDMGTSEVNDVLSALRFLQSRTDMDPGRIAVIGASRGSALALRSAESTDQFKLVVGYSSVMDYRLFFCHHDCAESPAGKRWCQELWSREKVRSHPHATPDKFCITMKKIAGCQPWEPGCRIFEAGSPLLHLDQLRAPVLLHHGEGDDAVAYQDVLALDRHLNSLKLTHQIFIYKTKDYGVVRHGFFSASNSEYNPAAAKVAWQRTLQALDYYLKGQGKRPW